MNNEVKRILERAGWYADRRVNTKLIIDSLEEEGYTYSDIIIEFLEQFWELKIIFENKRNHLNEDVINFSFEHASHLEVPERVNFNYSQRIDKKLCLIGSVYRDHMVLMMSEDGNVYAAYDNYLCFIAKDGYSALEAIILDLDFIEVPQ